MIAAPPPSNEAERVAELSRYCILDTPPESDFDDLTQLAAYVCETPIALVSLVDSTRQWFKARYGLEAVQPPRDVAFCAHAILGTAPLIVPDALRDARFADTPLVTTAPHVRFYAGVPLITAGGAALGTLCVIDHGPRAIRPEQVAALTKLARQVTALLDLRLANQSALATANQRSRFLANMTHELRTPLAGILGMNELLTATELTPEQRRMLCLQDDAAHQLSGLVAELLDLAQLEAHAMRMTVSTFDLSSLAESVVEELGSAAQKKRLSLRLNVRLAAPARLGDARRIRQILVGLINNSIKSTTQGGVVVTVEECGQGVKLTVADTGVGMRPAEQRKLFTRYWQSAPGAPSGPDALGLALAKELTTWMGGHLLVDSELTRGTCFACELPALHAA